LGDRKSIWPVKNPALPVTKGLPLNAFGSNLWSRWVKQVKTQVLSFFIFSVFLLIYWSCLL